MIMTPARSVGMTLRNGVSAVVVIGLIAGCATVQQGVGGLQNSIAGMFSGYINESDVCVAERRALVDSGSLFEQDTLRKVGAAVFIGVVVGLITGDFTSGLAAGAVTLVGAYLAEYIEEQRSATEVATLVRTDVVQSNEQIDDVVAAFRDVDRCRRAEAAEIRADLRAGQIDRAAAQEQMAAVRQRRQEDIDQFSNIAKNISASAATYATAYNEIAADNNRRGFDVGDDGRIARSRSVPEKKATEEGSLSGASSGTLNQLQRDCLTNIRKRDDCFELVETANEDQTEFTL